MSSAIRYLYFSECFKPALVVEHIGDGVGCVAHFVGLCAMGNDSQGELGSFVFDCQK